MAPQPAGAAPIQPFPTLTVQTFLYPDKTIKPNSMEKESRQQFAEGAGRFVARKAEKGGGCCILPGVHAVHLSPGGRRRVFGRETGMDTCPSSLLLPICLPTPPGNPLLLLPSSYIMQGNAGRKASVPLDLFHYFVSNVKLAISHGHG